MEQTIIILIVVGLVLICTSIFLIIKEQKQREKLDLRLDEAFTSINTALETFDVQSTDFNKTVELIFREIEDKYQELFLLYGLIEDQKNSLSELSKNSSNMLKKAELEKVSANLSKDISNKIVGVKSVETTEVVTKPLEAISKTSEATTQLNKEFIFKNKNAEQIFKLSDQGMTVGEIAKILSIGKGEVQLLLNIRKA